MKPGELQVNLWQLVCALSKTFDLMSPALTEHNLRVAGLSVRITEALGLPRVDRAEIALAAAMHDIGAFSLKQRLELLSFEDANVAAHAKAGAQLLRGFPPFERIAPIVLFHHLPWAQGGGATSWGVPVPLGSHIIHLADRVAVLISGEQGVLRQAERIRGVIAAHVGEIFHPEVAAAFATAARRDSFWLEVTTEGHEDVLQREFAGNTIALETESLLALARLLCRIIDFKSEYTASHSSGVAAAGTSLARIVGFSREECRLFEIAAFLHDLGKLAIPTEILEKPGKLSPEEWNIMRTHAYFTYQILCPLEALGAIGSWGSLHQERLDGSGYPFSYAAEELPLGARIMAVADVFTALTEDRPYRAGLSAGDAAAALRQMAGQLEIDGRIVELLMENYDEVDAARSASQAAARREYAAFRREITAWGPGTSVGMFSGAGSAVTALVRPS